MRRCLFVFVVALLPLRVWAGDVLLTQTALAQAPGAASVSEESDCLPHALLADSQTDSDGTAGDQVCGSGELCLTALSLPAGDLHIASVADDPKPASPATLFLSAAPASAFKPPIS